MPIPVWDSVFPWEAPGSMARHFITPRSPLARSAMDPATGAIVGNELVCFVYEADVAKGLVFG